MKKVCTKCIHCIEAMPENDYDPKLDAVLSYRAAIAELRKRSVIEGRFEPRDEDERRLVESKCA